MVLKAEQEERSRSCVSSLVVFLLTLFCMDGGLGANEILAQQWRGRLATRVQYLDARPLVLDSVPVGETTMLDGRDSVGDTLVRCAPGARYCYFYRPGSIESTAPLVSDLSFNVWGFGLPGLRAYTAVRLRGAFGSEEFWPRSDDHFDLFAAYVEFNRSRYRFRVGRDYQVSGLGYYGYDGGSAVVRLDPARIELEAYGGWGLARGLADPVNADALSSLEEFQPRERDYLFGFRGSARPSGNLSFEAIYQREIQTDRSGISSERAAVDAWYAPSRDWRFRGYADYDLTAGWWGKARLHVGWSATPWMYVEGRVLRYRPLFSLQTIWVAFSPTPYYGAGLTLGFQPRRGLRLDLSAERRRYAETDAEVPFMSTTDRAWIASAYLAWQLEPRLGIDARYSLDFSVGAALSAGGGRVTYEPNEKVALGLRFSAFQRLDEFRIAEGRVWSLGAEARWRSRVGTLWGVIDRYDHDDRGAATSMDWTQTRAELGWAVYLGPEPGMEY